MGLGCTRCSRPDDRHIVGSGYNGPAPVTLHVYNIGTSTALTVVNSLLRPLGGGLFHCGVEVYDWEWSYSYAAAGTPDAELAGTGVFCCRPRQCEGHTYSVSIEMGGAGLTEEATLKMISDMESEWPMDTYDLLHRNCCHFCDELCKRLGVGSIPQWLSSLADIGAAMEKASEVKWCCKVKPPGATVHHEDCGGAVGYPLPLHDIIVDPLARSAEPFRANPVSFRYGG